MDEKQKNSGYSVGFGQIFIDRFDKFPLKDKDKITKHCILVFHSTHPSPTALFKALIRLTTSFLSLR